jgi:hypothetical protein
MDRRIVQAWRVVFAIHLKFDEVHQDKGGVHPELALVFAITPLT